MKLKYPSTPHLDWSQGVTDDDILLSTDIFSGENVVVTEKYDGECTTLATEYMHARSLDSQHNVTRDWVKSFWSSFKMDIPEGYRICGENMYAKHSIYYEELESYFYGFSLWDKDYCLDWEQTTEWFKLLGITPAKVLYIGQYNESIIKKLWNSSKYNTMEGYVVRNVKGFHYKDFQKNIAKFVRKGHVQTNSHWLHSEIIPNKLKAIQ